MYGPTYHIYMYLGVCAVAEYKSVASPLLLYLLLYLLKIFL